MECRDVGIADQMEKTLRTWPCACCQCCRSCAFVCLRPVTVGLVAPCCNRGARSADCSSCVVCSRLPAAGCIPVYVAPRLQHGACRGAGPLEPVVACDCLVLVPARACLLPRAERGRRAPECALVAAGAGLQRCVFDALAERAAARWAPCVRLLFCHACAIWLRELAVCSNALMFACLAHTRSRASVRRSLGRSPHRSRISVRRGFGRECPPFYPHFAISDALTDTSRVPTVSLHVLRPAEWPYCASRADAAMLSRVLPRVLPAADAVPRPCGASRKLPPRRCHPYRMLSSYLLGL